MIRSGRAELKDWLLGIELAVAAVAEGVIHLVTHLRSSPDGHVSVDYPDAFKALLWTLFCFLWLLVFIFVHQIMEPQTNHRGRQAFILVFLMNLVGAGLLGGFVYLIQGGGS